MSLLIQHREEFGDGPHGLLSSNRSGGIYLYRSASDTFNKVARKLGLPVGSGLHILRHTYASNALAAGVNIKALQEQLGHESITETLDTYGHMMTESRADYVAKLDAAHRAKMKARKRPHLRAAEGS